MSIIRSDDRKQLRRYTKRLNRAVKHQELMRELLQRIMLDVGRDAVFGDDVRLKPAALQTIKVWVADRHVKYLSKRVAWFTHVT